MFKGEYTGDWHEIAKKVKDDAGWNCVRCRHGNCRKTGHVLTVHHFDGDKGNNAPWNLMALCQRCHLSVQATTDPSQGLMVLPSSWSMPYIAGMFMAGNTPEPLTWDLAKWIKQYEEDEKLWPKWAPQIKVQELSK